MAVWILLLSVPAFILFLIIWDVVNFERPRSTQDDAIIMASRVTAMATIGIVVATVVGAGVAALQWSALKSTDEKIGRQLSLMEAEERPWISHSATPTITGPLVPILKNSALVPVHFKIKNSGKSPARNVGVTVKMIGPPRAADPIKEQERLCPRGDKSTANGFAMFPGDEYEVQRPVFLDPNDSAEMRANANGHMIVTTIVGCINYQFLDDEQVHRTGVVLSLTRKTPSKNNSYRIDLDEGQVEQGDVSLAYDIVFGNGPAY